MVYAVGRNIIAQDIVDQFAAVVTAAANSGIVWGSNNPPTYEGQQLIPTDRFGGMSTDTIPIGITGDSLDGGPPNDDNPIKAVAGTGNIYNTLKDEATRYTVLRLARAQFFVQGGGGNTGSRPTPGYLYNQAMKSFMSSAYLQTINPTSNIAANDIITLAALTTQINNMLAAYTTAQNTEAGPFEISVCHASCHSSCHGSRGRR